MDESPRLQTFELETHHLSVEVTRENTGGNRPAAEDAEVNGHSLPPYDGGKAAWRLLLAAFVFEALLWGGCLILKPMLSSQEWPPADDLDRLPAFVRSLPELLFTATGVQWLAIHCSGRDNCLGHVLPGCSHRDTFHQAILQVSALDDLDRM